MKMDEQTRLLTLAHLKNGLTPSEAAERTNISYSSSLKLKKELIEAEKRDDILSLFNLEAAALEILLESVQKQLIPAIDAFGIGELVNDEVDELTGTINSGNLLDKTLLKNADILANKIGQAALISNNADTIKTLSDALCNLQLAFKSSNTGSVPTTGFEKFLKP